MVKLKHSVLVSSRTSTVSGWTLTELLAVVVMVGVMAAIAVPGLAPIYHRMQLDSTTSEVEHLLKATRLEALRSQQTCQVSVRSDRSSLTSECSLDSNLRTLELNPLITIEATGDDVETIYFSRRGTTTQSGIAWRLSHTSERFTPRCVVVANLAGVIRRGMVRNEQCYVEPLAVVETITPNE